MTFNFLALDGGGIRGYMTAKILHEVEKQADVSMTDHDVVQGYSGTSTGGLLSIGLATGNTPKHLANIYHKKAHRIFQHNDSKETLFAIRLFSPFFPKLKTLITGVGIFDSQYKADNLKEIAEEIAGSKTFGDIPQDRMLAVNTASLKVPGSQDGWRAATFSNHDLNKLTRTVGDQLTRSEAHVDRLADTQDVPLVDGALATSAAPSYFPPHKVKGLGFFTDGGVFANNPVMNGYAIAHGIMGHNDISVISIGTGVNTVGIPQSAIKKPLSFGLVEWFGAERGVPTGALLDIMMTCSAENMTEIADIVFGQNIVRLNPILDEPVPLDATDKFDVMDRAVSKLVESNDFQKAVKLAKGWAKKSAAEAALTH